jgi:hypothetical protein
MLSAARGDAASTFEQPPSIGPLIPWGMPCIASRTGTPTPTCPRAGPTYPRAKRRGHAPLRGALCEVEQEHAFARRVGVGEPAAALRAAADGERPRLMVVGAGSRTGPSRVAWACRAGARATGKLPGPRGSARGVGSDGRLDAPTARVHLRRLRQRSTRAQRRSRPRGPTGSGRVRGPRRPRQRGTARARARTECPALIVAASCGAEGWHAALPGSGLVRLATSGSTPLLFVPPAYRHTAVASPRVAKDAGRPAEPAKARPVSSAAPA